VNAEGFSRSLKVKSKVGRKQQGGEVHCEMLRTIKQSSDMKHRAVSLRQLDLSFVNTGILVAIEYRSLLIGNSVPL